jgi:hypothetical protein
MKRTTFRIAAGSLLLMSMCWAEDRPALPQPDPGNVTLTLDEYNRLVALAAKPPKKPDVAPLPYSIKHAAIKLHVEDSGVTGSVEFDGEVFHKGISKVALASGLTILDAHQNGKAVPLVLESDTHAALLPGPGEFSVSLDTAMPLRLEPGRACFSLPVPSAGSAEMTLVIPGEHTLASISPGVITSRKSEKGHTEIEATLVPGQAANVWWATREVVAPTVPRQVRFLSDMKTLVSVSEAEMRVAVLADITMVQGETSTFRVQIPEGYEVTGVTGPSLDSAETQPKVVNLRTAGNNEPAHPYILLQLNNPGLRNHQFLISLERSLKETAAEAPFVSFKGAQRETGEVLVEGAGAMEITATEGGGLKRMDVKEANPFLRSMAHYPPQAAFRYHRQASETPTLALNWVRFPDGAVLAAVAESADVTTMVTSEGKSLTEIKLVVKNQAQPFLKINLPQGTTILSADVAGERVKPVQGPDGNRVPLLRPGFRPVGSYTVSFVFMHSGTPFAKKGGADLSLPSMDIPISLLNWEVFLPERYKVKDFGGDVIAANRVPEPLREQVAWHGQVPRDKEVSISNGPPRIQFPAGQMGGFVADQSGAIVANAKVTITSVGTGISRSTVTDSAGQWMQLGLPSGNYQVRVDSPGFKVNASNVSYDSNQPSMFGSVLNVGSASEVVEVAGSAPMVNTTESALAVDGRNFSHVVPLAPGVVSQNASASANVMNLQKRVAGVLPVPIDVPRAGTSFSFVRPLVLDEETKVTFTYKSR